MVFFSTVGSLWCDQCHNAGQVWRHGSCWDKVKSFFLRITTPLYVLFKPCCDTRPTRRKVTHHGIVYFYLLMSCTIVVNLWEQKNRNTYRQLPYKFLQSFETAVMLLSLILMLVIFVATRNRVRWDQHEKNLILYFRTGLYVFGISSTVYAALKIYNYCNCKDALNIFVNIAKFLFVLGQILFLNYFYQAKLPGGGMLIQISLAHILGANLSLWIWTLCKEVWDSQNESYKDDCFPIDLGHTEKYFYPFFIEYLLLVASMVYELWMDLQQPADARRRVARHHWVYENYQELESGTIQLHRSGTQRPAFPVRRRRKFTPSLAFSLILGLAFSSIFLAFILAANDSSKEDSQWFRYFVYCNIAFYCTQLFACYVIKVCSQSQPADRRRSSLNLDDALLYFGLAGIMTWEGFHFYGLFFNTDWETVKVKSQFIFFVHGLLGLIEDVVQTVILVSVRRLCSREDTNSRTITSMSLFLLATNFCFWIQNSFYIEQHLENPGENRSENMDVFGNILNPIIIFFRFHSTTCCYQMWVIFSNTE